MNTRSGAVLCLVVLLAGNLGVQIAAWHWLSFMAVPVIVLSSLSFLYLLRRLQARWHANGWV